MDLENTALKTGVTVLEDCNSHLPVRRQRVGPPTGTLASNYGVTQDVGLPGLKAGESWANEDEVGTVGQGSNVILSMLVGALLWARHKEKVMTEAALSWRVSEPRGGAARWTDELPYGV